jgi:hypothetical protein
MFADIARRYGPGRRRRLAVMGGMAAGAGVVIGGVLQLARTSAPAFDFQQFYNAAMALNRGEDMYAPFVHACAGPRWCYGGYIYPPLLAEVLRPFAALPPALAGQLWTALTYVFLALAVTVTWLALRRWLSPTTAGFLLIAAAAFTPVWENFYNMQVNTLLLLILALFTLAYLRGENGIAGFLLGIAVMLRVSPLVLLPLLVLEPERRRRARGILGMLLSTGLLALFFLATVPGFGEYITLVLPRVGQGTSQIWNLSPLGVMLRAADGGGIGWLQTAAPAIAAAASTVLGVISILACGWPTAPLHRAAAVAVFVALTPLVSGLTWAHHLVPELLALALIAPSLRRGSRVWWLALLAYLFLNIHHQLSDRLILLFGGLQPARWQLPLVVLASSLPTIGAFLLWLACVLVVGTARRAGATLSTPPAPDYRSVNTARHVLPASSERITGPSASAA